MLHKILRKILHTPVLLAFTVLAIGWLFIELRGIFVIIFVSYIIMAALTPSVERLRSWRIPKGIAAATVYIVTVLAILLVIVPIIPFLIEQVQLLFMQFPSYLDRVTHDLGFNITSDQIQDIFTDEIGTIGQNAVQVTQAFFGGLFSLLSIFVISFYLLLDHEKVKTGISSLFHKDYRQKAVETLSLVEVKLGAWLRGQLLLSCVIGLTTWVALYVVGVPFALPLALIAGILEIIPTLGPILAAIPAVIIAFNVSPTLGIVTIAIYLGIQFLENNLIVPKVMQRAVGLNPVVIIIGIIVGSQLLGVAGALLSIPFISMIKVILSSLDEEK